MGNTLLSFCSGGVGAFRLFREWMWVLVLDMTLLVNHVPVVQVGDLSFPVPPLGGTNSL